MASEAFDDYQLAFDAAVEDIRKQLAGAAAAAARGGGRLRGCASARSTKHTQQEQPRASLECCMRADVAGSATDGALAAAFASAQQQVRRQLPARAASASRVCGGCPLFEPAFGLDAHPHACHRCQAWSWSCVACPRRHGGNWRPRHVAALSSLSCDHLPACAGWGTASPPACAACMFCRPCSPCRLPTASGSWRSWQRSERGRRTRATGRRCWQAGQARRP